MELFLIRHADALPLGEGGIVEDAERPLTDAGRVQAKALARALRKVGAQFDRVLSSPAVRAKQTAEHLLAALSTTVPLETCNQLAMGFKPRKLAGLLAECHDSALGLVGHQPDLAEFTAWLIGSRKAHIDLAKGGFAHVTCSDGIFKGSGTLELLVTPEWY